ncbi:MAG: DUF4080 domain-containing protein [Eubacteriales bacterium]|nr:DUF4080 domain-containing protein [Eubacteriales bacterium]
MRILLTTLNSKFIHSNLALRYLYSVAGRYRDQMEIDEYTINHTDDYIFTELMRKDSKLYCFSCYIWNIERTLYLAQTLKQAKPNVKILLGGPEVSYEGEEFLFQNPYVDYVIQGEGEGAFSAFLKQYFATMPDYDSVWGLLYRSGAIVRKNKPCPPLKFESVPNPYELLPAEEDKILYYESSRGCPFNCAYCLSCIERQVRALPLERVKEDLKYFIYKRVKQVKFVDRTFNFDARRSLEIMKYLIEKDNGITNYHLELCGELMTEEHFALLSQARPGLFQFEIGVQSTHPSTLNAINRRGNFDKIAETVRRIQAIGGIHLHLDLIAGLPLEDYNLFRHSFNDVYGLQPDALQVGFLKLLKGTPLREDARLYGYVYRQKAPYEVITNSYISADGLVRIKMIAEMVDLYYNRGGFEKTLEEALAYCGNAFDFYEELALWYYAKGHNRKSHRKEDLYRILRVYLRRWGQEGVEDPFDELLEADLEKAMNPEAVKRFHKEGWGLKG